MQYCSKFIEELLVISSRVASIIKIFKYFYRVNFYILDHKYNLFFHIPYANFFT
jgi:hypothetical protein